MSPFRYVEPTTVEDAAGLLAEDPDDRLLMAGGTALVPLMRTGYVQPAMVIGLRSVEGLGAIETIDGELVIGASVSHAAIADSPLVRSSWPLLARACAVVGTVRIRSQGTLAGNLIHADPNQDPPPALLALGARVRVQSPSDERTIPMEELLVDYLETSIAPDEVLTRIEVPAVSPGTRGVYHKFLPRSQDDYATVAVAVLARQAADGHIEHLRIALGGVGTVALRASVAEQVLEGAVPTPALIADAAATLDDAIDPIDDARGPAAYKRTVARVTLERALGEACGLDMP